MTPRRVLAVILVLPLTAVFALGLIAGRLDATLLEPSFVKEQARDLRLYQRLHDEGTRRLVRTVLDDPTKRPENLRAIALPTDRKAEDSLTALTQSFLPPALVERETEETIDAVLPWLAGKTDHFAVNLSLHDGFTATFGHPTPGQPSVFERTWRDLGMGERTVVSLAQSYDRNPANASKPLPGAPAGSRGVLPLIEANRQAAGAWFDQQWFGVVDQAMPYLAGDTKTMDARISFASFPFLAGPFAGAMHVPPEQLATQGWRLTDADLKRQLSGSSNPTLSRADNTIALFTEKGGTITDSDIVARSDQQRAKDNAAGKPVEGISISDMRRVLSAVRMAGIYGAPLLCALLVLGIAFLGGTTWASRLAWGAAALLVAAAIGLAATTAVYRATLSSPLDRWVTEQRTRPPSGAIPADLRADMAKQLQKIVGQQADRAALNASAWLIVAMGGLAAGLVWDRVERRRAPVPAEAEVEVRA
ncbi:MAG: hypothetical protein EPO16_01665 [Dehalococcoidia bacterium]|nr:MAG: hypothetical protein EPO16_01665 [Dehalococcoidia bacterium]